MHFQGAGNPPKGLQKPRKFFVVKILIPNSYALKILQTLFANPAPVAAFEKGGGGGVPLKSHGFPKIGTLPATLLSRIWQIFFQKIRDRDLPPASRPKGFRQANSPVIPSVPVVNVFEVSEDQSRPGVLPRKRSPLIVCGDAFELRQLPDCIEDCAIDPLHDGNGTIAVNRSLRLSTADAFHFFFDFSQRPNRKARSLDCVD